MSTSKQKPLKPDDFPVHAEGETIKKQDGTPIAETENSTSAEDIAERLNEDEARREEDKWSACMIGRSGWLPNGPISARTQPVSVPLSTSASSLAATHQAVGSFSLAMTESGDDTALRSKGGLERASKSDRPTAERVWK